jgi:hypothetical protein
MNKNNGKSFSVLFLLCCEEQGEHISCEAFCDLQALIRSREGKRGERIEKISSKINNFPYSLSIRGAERKEISFLMSSKIKKKQARKPRPGRSGKEEEKSLKQQIINQKITHESDGKFLRSRSERNTAKRFSSTGLLPAKFLLAEPNYAQFWCCLKFHLAKERAELIEENESFSEKLFLRLISRPVRSRGAKKKSPSIIPLTKLMSCFKYFCDTFSCV